MVDNHLRYIFSGVAAEYFNVSFRHIVAVLKIKDEQKATHLEELLISYVRSCLGYKIWNNYEGYYLEIKAYFNNLLTNTSLVDLINVEELIKRKQEGEEKTKESHSELYPLSYCLIDIIRESYASDKMDSVVLINDKKYTIKRIFRKKENIIPSTIIYNIEKLEEILNEFIKALLNTNNSYKLPLENMERDEAISYIFNWVIKNVTCHELGNLESFFEKYTSFLKNDVLSVFEHSTLLGVLLGDELYVLRSQSNVNYETPYCLTFFMKSDDVWVKLPIIRYGIKQQENKKIVHILATQTSQNNPYKREEEELNRVFRSMLDKSRFFRQFNPSHMVSLILAFGIFHGLGINDVEIADYLPFRRQRLVLENQKNDEELDDLQSRLTDKNIYTYFRMNEFLSEIDISSLGEFGEGIWLQLNDIDDDQNFFFQKLYNLGYNALRDKKDDDIVYKKKYS